MRAGQRIIRAIGAIPFGLLAGALVLVCCVVAAIAVVLGRLAGRVAGTRLTRSTPAAATAPVLEPVRTPAPSLRPMLRWCHYCERRTEHTSRPGARRPICIYRAQHRQSEAYLRLAACYADPTAFPGCICAPGETTLFSGRPDPQCVAQVHRP